MRTTLTLADDVVAGVEAARRERALGMSEAVNQLIRAGLAAQTIAPRPVFVQTSFDVGVHISFDNVAEALETLDGPAST